ncbi:SIMPL domain-containing protein [Methanolobus vulcani]|uniref:SIMPL domain-containing protein n=1 Tax=Methanolobus vulcani TaxID=38026 RepID=A0A7Z8KMM4_9EURY|nr:SIMPL domain-containing protein [Methanolobus vulcani]TQD23812.1 SIMPL domain-containing protein [Methanolobus vulcani]
MSSDTKNDKSYIAVIALSVVLVVMSLTIYAISQDGAEQTTADTITMSGYAEQKVVPDTASLSIGVVIQSETAQEASDENAAIMSAVISGLKELGLEDKEIQTSYVSVYPVYNYDGERTITGYSASNSVQVTTTKLDYLSDIIDNSTASGANQIGSISFTVSDDMQEQLRDELVGEAVDNARTKADELADNLGLKITGVQTASMYENGDTGIYYGRYVVEEAAMDAGGISTPIEPGESTVSMSVDVTYYIG